MDHSLGTYASRKLVVVSWTDTLEHAYAVMRGHGVRHLPVESNDGNIIGIVSDRDFQRAMQVSQPAFSSGYAPSAAFEPGAVVRDFMSWPVEAIDREQSIGEAARLMLDKKISALLVSRGDAVVGIVTTDDLLRALLEETEPATQKIKREFESAILRLPVGQVAHQLSNAGI